MSAAIETTKTSPRCRCKGDGVVYVKSYDAGETTTCKSCRGDGDLDDETCWECEGYGTVVSGELTVEACELCAGRNVSVALDDCRTCGGRGALRGVLCHDCVGDGEVPRFTRGPA